MKTNPSWKDYFLFSKKERIVVITGLVAFISFCLFLVFYHPDEEQPVIKNLDEQVAQLSVPNNKKGDSLAPDIALTDVSYPSAETINSPSELFVFDPNTLDEAGFQRLGLRNKTIHTIMNYRSKGGHFYKPEDLRKIYGLQPGEADRLLPYVKINASQNQSSFTKQNDYNKNSTQQTYNKPKPRIINVNSATVEEWNSLPAIGDVLSNRIVKYRDKMGGFTSVEQLKKVYGLSDSAYTVILPYLSISATNKEASEIKAVTSSFKKLNINTASVNELKSNPAISSDVAEAIVIYRKQHGNYSSVEGIKKIVFINDELYQKIAPYLTAE